ncbi:hypothetical protein NE237_011063 [Protea cynaroides]|uniref:KIB1-4 beta-propeller domain-containing protein n=1 Tax=Protea cynaroides TaxID=273540 RepID=A0A9Q0GXG1_9MAGN|nr:hypothetical protein NE237_011063 [Protea cynaroides]
MLPSNGNIETRNFFTLSSGKCYCCGSTEGWLITVEESTGEIQLFNPVSRGCILLPSLSTFSYISSTLQFYLRTLVEHQIILYWPLCIDKRLAYYKSRADGWTAMTTGWIWFVDVIFYKDYSMPVSNNGSVLTYDFSSKPPMETLISGRQPEGRTCERYYLVESLGDLLLVLRHFEWFDNDDTGLHFRSTIRFQVRKWDESKQKWIGMKSIGDSILFLGYDCSMSVVAQDFLKCKRKSIYFNCDCCYRLGRPFRYNDIGVFNIENASVEPFYDSSFPIWITPTYPYLLDCI